MLHFMCRICIYYMVSCEHCKFLFVLSLVTWSCKHSLQHSEGMDAVNCGRPCWGSQQSNMEVQLSHRWDMSYCVLNHRDLSATHHGLGGSQQLSGSVSMGRTAAAAAAAAGGGGVVSWWFCGVTTNGFGGKARLQSKASCYLSLSPCFRVTRWEISVPYPLLARFCLQLHHRNISLNAFRTHETRGESWADRHSWEVTAKWCSDLNANDASRHFAFSS